MFGGTFDPPHLAHAILPAQAAQQLNCSQILYVPAAINPLKKQPTVSSQHRTAMLLLAIADVPNAKISTIELDRAGPSYMIDTLRALRKEYSVAPQLQAVGARTASPSRAAVETSTDVPSPDFRLLIGCDQALDFHRWKDWQQILTFATPAVMLRPPWNEDSFREALREKYSKVETESWMNWTLRLPNMDISATDIRSALKAGDETALQQALDPAVIDYIRKNGLYI